MPFMHIRYLTVDLQLVVEQRQRRRDVEINRIEVTAVDHFLHHQPVNLVPIRDDVVDDVVPTKRSVE